MPDSENALSVGHHETRPYPAPLTPIQRAYLAGREAPPPLGGVGCTYYFEFICEPGLALSWVEAAWNTLIDRHEVLRMVVLDDTSFDILANPPPYRIEQRHLANAAELAEMRARLRSANRTLYRWPLFDVRASVDHVGNYRLHVRFELIALDAEGLFTILLELGALLRGESLPEIEGRFADHAHAIERLAAKVRPSRRIAVAPQLPLLAGNNQPCFERVSESLDAESVGGFRRVARDWGVSRNALALAALAEVLRLWSTNEDFTINVVAGRRHKGDGSMVGALGEHARALWVDCVAADAHDFRGRADKIGRRLRERVGDMLGDRGELFVADTAEINLASVVFASFLGVTPSGVMSPTRAVAGLGWTDFAASQTPHVHLDVQLHEDDTRVIVSWDYIAELFPAGLAETMFNAYVLLLRRIAKHPGVGTESAPVEVPEAQLHQRLRVNAPAGEIPKGLLQDGFLARVDLAPQAPAVFDGAQVITYAELYAQSGTVAMWLRARGLQRGDIVAVDLARGWRQAAAVIGILIAGGVYLPCEQSWPAERVRRIVADAGASFVVSDRLGAQHGIAVPVGDFPHTASPTLPFEPAAPTDPGDIAYLIYTSGSTGHPKGVAISHRAALNTIADINRRFVVGPQDRTLCLSSLAFDLSVYDIFGLLSAGGSLVMPPPGTNQDPRTLLALCREHHVTIWNSVPALFQLAVEHQILAGESLPGALRIAMLSGDWIPRWLPDRAHDMKPGLQVFSLGGATEASIWSIVFDTRDTPEDCPSIPYGYPMANQSFHILDRRMRDRPDWVEGDLYIAGEGLASEYWRDREKTAAAFIQHPASGERLYRTGDRARYRPGALIEFLGRRDQQVKIGGYRIETGEIESALESLAEIRAAVVVALDSRSSGHKLLHALIVRTDGATIPQGDPELRERLELILPDYMLPSRIVAVSSIPLSTNGKIDRTEVSRILQRSQPGQVAAVPHDAPVSTVNGWQEIRELIERVLSLERLPQDASLIEMGASSLDIMRLSVKLTTVFGIEVRPRELAVAADAGALQELLVPRRSHQAVEPASGVEAWLVRNRTAVLTEPIGRQRFKTETTLGRLKRIGDSSPMTVELETSIDLGDFDRRWSCREFVDSPLPLARVEHMLRGCRMAQRGGELVAQWASAGSTYPLEIALASARRGPGALPIGWWRYEALAHRLERLASAAPAFAGLSFANSDWLASAPGLIAISADMNRIAPLYGASSLQMAWIEIGALCDSLERAGAEAGLSLCQIGDIDGEALDRSCGLPEGQFTLHAVAVGVPPPDARVARAARISPIAKGLEEGPI